MYVTQEYICYYVYRFNLVEINQRDAPMAMEIIQYNTVHVVRKLVLLTLLLCLHSIVNSTTVDEHFNKS